MGGVDFYDVELRDFFDFGSGDNYDVCDFWLGDVDLFAFKRGELVLSAFFCKYWLSVSKFTFVVDEIEGLDWLCSSFEEDF